MSKKKEKKYRKAKDNSPAQGVPEESVEEKPDEAVGKEVETTEKTAADIEREMEELMARFQRLGADYQNYQKRSHRQIAEAGQFARENIVKSILPVLDNFEHALQNSSESQDVPALLQGIQIVYDHLINILESAGLRRITIETGCDFDPSLHEAMLHEETDKVDPNAVIRELACGYIMGDRTLRPAKVSIAKAPAKSEAADQEEQAEKNESQDEINEEKD